MKFNLGKVKGLASAVWAFSKKNAPSLMTGGSIALGWFAVYIFWKQSKKAESKIAYEESKLEEYGENSEDAKLPFKEKAMIYLQYCWIALVLGLGSSGLSIWAHKIDMSRLAEMYILTQFLEEKNGKQENLIEKLKAEIKDPKKIAKVEEEALSEDYPKDEVIKWMTTAPGNGQTLFIDKVTKARFRANIVDVRNGIMSVNEILKNKRNKIVRSKIAGPFFASSNTAYNVTDAGEDISSMMPDIYSSIDLEVLLKAIGEVFEDGIDCRLGELLEFRYYGGGDLLKDSQILDFKNFMDPSSGYPAVCFIDYAEFLSPTSELIERNPL